MSRRPSRSCTCCRSLGALLAANYDELQGWSHRLVESANRRLLGWTLTALGPSLLVAYWMLRPLTSGVWSDATLSLWVAGTFMIVATVALWPASVSERGRLRAPQTRRALDWLGSISFSL